MKNLILRLFNVNENELEEFSTNTQEDGTIECIVRLVKKVLYCPICGSQMVSNGFKKKRVNHSIITQTSCFLTYYARYYRCLNCGHAEYEKNPFSTKGFQNSILVMDKIMKDLHNPQLNYTMISQKYNLSVTQVIRYFDSFVVIPRIPLPINIGIDEIYSNMAQRRNAKYLGIITDNDHFNLVEILTSRNKTDLNNFFQSYSKEERDKVKYVTIDMWEAYEEVANVWLKNAIVAVDPFHVIEHLTTDFKKIRIRISNKYVNGSNAYYLIHTWHHLLESDKYDLYGPRKFNKTFNSYLNYGDLVNMLLDLDDELKLAYNLKEWYRRFNKNCTFEDAPGELDCLIAAFQKSQIHEYEEFYKLLIHWKQEIINSFIRSEVTDCRLSNSKAESMNKNLQTYVSISNGLSNYKRFRARMLYCFNDRIFYNLTTKLTSLKRDSKERKDK